MRTRQQAQDDELGEGVQVFLGGSLHVERICTVHQ